MNVRVTSGEWQTFYGECQGDFGDIDSVIANVRVTQFGEWLALQ